MKSGQFSQVAAIVGMALLALQCGGGDDDDSPMAVGGKPGTGGAGGAGGATTGTFSEVQGVIESLNCAGCHYWFSNESQLYARLTSPIGGNKCKTDKLVDKDAPAKSVLPAVLAGSASCDNGTVVKMPLGCGSASMPCATSTQIATIVSWIAAGSPQN